MRSSGSISVATSTLTIDTPISNVYSSFSLTTLLDTSKLQSSDLFRLTFPPSLRMSAPHSAVCPTPLSLLYAIEDAADDLTAATCPSYIFPDDDSRRAAHTQCVALASAPGGSLAAIPGIWRVRGAGVDGLSVADLELQRNDTAAALEGIYSSSGSSVGSAMPLDTTVTVHCSDARVARGGGGGDTVEVSLLREEDGIALSGVNSTLVLQTVRVAVPPTARHTLRAALELQPHNALTVAQLTSRLPSMSSAEASAAVDAFGSYTQTSPQPIWGTGISSSGKMSGRNLFKFRTILTAWGDSLRKNEFIRVTFLNSIPPRSSLNNITTTTTASTSTDVDAEVFPALPGATGYTAHAGGRTRCQLWAHATHLTMAQTADLATLPLDATAWLRVRGQTRVSTVNGELRVDMLLAEAVSAQVLPGSEGVGSSANALAWKKYYSGNQEMTTSKIPNYTNPEISSSGFNTTASTLTSPAVTATTRPLWLECTHLRAPAVLSSSTYAATTATATSSSTTASSTPSESVQAPPLSLTAARVSVHAQSGAVLATAPAQLPRVRPSAAFTAASGAVAVGTALPTPGKLLYRFSLCLYLVETC